MTEKITREELRTLIETGGVTVVDALPASYYDQRHLPGALNLVEDEVDARAEDLLPGKGAPIVTYCSNTACNNSQAVANRLANLGYTNVRKYAEGIQDWTEHHLPVESTVNA
jgi:rhodanese-related sulfurtransferase